VAGLNFGYRLAGVMVLTALLSSIGLISGAGAGHLTAISWANAAVASAILLERRSHWVQLLAAGFAGTVTGHLVVHDPVWQTLALSACSTGGTAIAVYGVAIVRDERIDLARQRQLVRFVVFAILLGPLLGSISSGLVLHWLMGSPIRVALKLFPADALGMGLVVPLALGLARKDTRELFSSGRVVDTLLSLLLTAIGATVLFSAGDFPWPFLIIPPLLFLVAHLGLRGGMLACCAVAAIGACFTVSAQANMFAHVTDPPVQHRLLIFQLFMVTAVLSVTVVGVVTEELERSRAAEADSSERYHALAQSMEALATEDPLTGVANRRMFDQTILREWQRAIRNSSPISLLLFDVDHFKAFIDLYGRPEADNCLMMVARVAIQNSRRSSDVVARFGGDEFAIIMPETSAEGAREIAERVRVGVLRRAMPHKGNGAGLVTISIGCATRVPQKYANVTDFISAVDAALYGAKQGGLNRVEVSTV